MPWLEFRRDGPTEEQAATEAALRRWESEAVAEPIGDRGLHGEDDEETSAETRQHAAEEAGPSSAIDSWEEEDGVTPEERIRDIMRAMAEDGASEEDIRARVEAEIKQVLEGMVQESGGRGGDPERQDSQ